MSDTKKKNKISAQFIVKILVLTCIFIAGILFARSRSKETFTADAFAFTKTEKLLRVENDTVYSQSFVSANDIVSGVQFMVRYSTLYDEELSSDISISVDVNVYYQTKENLIYTETFPVSVMNNEDYTGVAFASPSDQCMGETFYVDFVFHNTLPKYNVSMVLALNNSYPSAVFTTNGYDLSDNDANNQPLATCLQSITVGPKTYRSTIFFTFFLATLILTVCVAMVMFSKPGKLNIARIYLIAALGFGISYSLMIPVMVAPDEPVHLMKAYQVSNKMMGIDAYNSTMRACDAEAYFQCREVKTAYYKYYFEKLHEDAGNQELVDTYMDPVNAPDHLFYFPALGITIGRLLGLNTILTYMLGRFFNCLLFALCTYYAIKRIPFGQSLIFVWGLLPIMMQQVNSFSYDCPLNALSIVIIALTLDIMYNDKNSGRIKKWPEWLQPRYFILALCCLLILPGKMGALLPVAILPLAILIKYLINNKKLKDKLKGLNKKQKNIMRAVIIAIILVILLGAALVYKILAAGPDTTHVTWCNAEGRSLAFFLKHPAQLIYIMANTVYFQATDYLFEMFGGYLGWVDIIIKPVFIVPFMFLIAFSAIKIDDERVTVSIPLRIWYILMGLGAIAAPMLAMLLYYTPRDISFIIGVQGRYFLPSLIMLLLILRARWASRSRKSDNWILAFTCIMNFVILGIIN